MKRWITIPIGVGVAAIAVLLWFRSREPRDSSSLRIGFNTWVGYGPFYIALQRGYFAKHGLRVTLERMEGTGERRAALIAARLDGAGSTLDDLIVGAAQGVPARMVLALDESAGADGILVGSDVTTFSQLRGKSIAVQPGFVNHFFLLYLLQQHGMSPRDITIVPMEPDKASAAFLSRDVDAAVTWEPHLSQVQTHRPDGRVLVTSKEYPGIIVDILVFRDEVIEERPASVRAFVEAWYEAIRFLAASPGEGHTIIANALGLSTSEIANMLQGVKFLARDENIHYHDRAQPVNVYSIAAIASRLWHQEGFIPRAVDAAALITDSFLTGAPK